MYFGIGSIFVVTLRVENSIMPKRTKKNPLKAKRRIDKSSNTKTKL